MLKNTIMKVDEFNTLPCLKRQKPLVSGYLYYSFMGLALNFYRITPPHHDAKGTVGGGLIQL